MRRLLGGLVLAAVCAGPALAQYPYVPVPAPRYEALPPPPGPPGAFLWEPGHYRWEGGSYAWVTGHYIGRHVGYREFIPGHWDRRPYGPPIWVPEHWR